MKRILLLDNYDSFTFNLAHYIEAFNVEVEIIRNDVKIKDFSRFSHCILSPGPGLPKEAGGMMSVIQTLDSKIPILGICLGMQAIGEFLNGTLYNQKEVKHGVSEKVFLQGSELFKGLNVEINVGLYHSWALSEDGRFKVTAKSSSDVLMAIENVERKMYGVQFHPESIMTDNGKLILGNFLRFK